METPRASAANRPVYARKASKNQAAELRRKNSEIWLEENREAIESYNELVTRHGVFSDGVRGF